MTIHTVVILNEDRLSSLQVEGAKDICIELNSDE